MNEWACYDGGAELYAAAGEDDPAWRQRHREKFLSALTGSVVADLGCGPGFDLAAFAARGLTTVGIDGSAAMLRIAAHNSPQSLLYNQDLRDPLPLPVDGLWCMFGLLHIPEADLLTCFKAWRQGIAAGGCLTIGLAQSRTVPMREVRDWLNQSTPCTFYYHPSKRVQDLLLLGGYCVVSAVEDTPLRYRGGVYEELKLSSYVIHARAV